MTRILAGYVGTIFFALAALIASFLIFGFETTRNFVVIAILYWMAKRLWSLYRLWISINASRGDPVASRLETLRLKASLFKFLAGVVGVCVFCVVGYYCVAWGAGSPSVVVALAGAVICGLPLERIGSRYWREYHAGFKKDLVADSLSRVFDDLAYKPDCQFDQSALRDIDFFAHFDRYGGNDLIEAAYKGIRFVQGDVRVEEQYTVTKRDAKGNVRTETRWRDVFRGRAMRFDFADKFRGRVQVIGRRFTGTRVGSSSGEWRTVETELADFKDLFTIYALDPLDAMAVLTPQMVEGIFYLERALGVPMAFYFADNSMIALISTGREAFDVSGGKTLLEERELLRRDVALITGFLDTMYFRPQEADVGEIPENTAARSRTTEERAEAAAAVAAEAGPTEGEKILRSTKRAAGNATGTALTLLPYAIVAAYLVSAVYAMIHVPDGLMAGASYRGGEWQASGMTVPTIPYLVVGGIFVVAGAFSKPVVAIIVLALHLLFLSVNLP